MKQHITGVNASTAAFVSALSMIPARLAWLYIPGYSLLEPNESVVVTAGISALFMIVVVKLIEMVRKTMIWLEERLDDQVPDPSLKELCLQWIRVILSGKR